MTHPVALAQPVTHIKISKFHSHRKQPGYFGEVADLGLGQDTYRWTWNILYQTARKLLKTAGVAARGLQSQPEQAPTCSQGEACGMRTIAEVDRSPSSTFRSTSEEWCWRFTPEKPRADGLAMAEKETDRPRFDDCWSCVIHICWFIVSFSLLLCTFEVFQSAN